MSANSTEYMRQWRAVNADRIREYKRANADRIRETDRQNYQANRERAVERMRQWRAANPERARENGRRSYEANAERRREDARQRRLNGYKTPRQQQAAEITMRLLQEQDGRCYLCEEPITPEQAVLEHDHRCCPKMNSFCAYCIRGAACSPCNRAIGLLHDNPALIERAARNLRVKLAEVDRRMASKPIQ